jgi:hypothetical protein
MNTNDKNTTVITKEFDPIVAQIIEDGYVRNTKLHRRFVMAQMFQMLNYKSYRGNEEGYNACLRNRYGYDYTLKMMLEEVRVLSQLETRDRESFNERVHFFDRETIAKVLEHHAVELEKYVDKLPVKKCKGIPYKRVKGENIFVSDLNKKLYYPAKRYASRVRYANTYNDIYYILRDFMNTMVKLPYQTKKSPAWIDAYKGEGAYYTLKNLIMFHNCKIIDDTGVYYGFNSMAYLNSRLDEYKYEGWRMFALMKKVINDNGIDTKTHIAEVCNK